MPGSEPSGEIWTELDFRSSSEEANLAMKAAEGLDEFNVLARTMIFLAGITIRS
jgi:hypothetical protein